MSGSQPNASPAVSPQGLLSPPPRRGPGVRRLNRLPLALACGAGVIVATAVGYTYHLRAAQSVASTAAEAEREPKPASGQQALAGAPESGHIETAQGQKPVEKTATTDTPAPTGPAVDEQAIAARKQAWADYYQALQQRRQQLVQAETQALTTDPTVSGAVGASTAGTAPPQPNSGPVTGLGAAGLLQPVLDRCGNPCPPWHCPGRPWRAIWRWPRPGRATGAGDRRQRSAVQASIPRAARGDR